MAETKKTFVVRVKSNVKGEFEWQLGACTLLVGKNAKGKSRVLDALSLALTGEARSDGLGKRESDLMLLAPPGAEKLYAEAVLSDGRSARWSCSGSTAKATRAVWEPGQPLATFIYDEAIALLRADPKKLREAIVARIGGKLTRAEIEQRIDRSLRDIVMPFFQFDEQDETPIDSVAVVSAELKGQLKTARETLKRIEASRESVPMPLSEEEQFELVELEKAFALGSASPEQLEEMRVTRDKLAAEHAALVIRLEELDVVAGAAEGLEQVRAVHALLDLTISRLVALERSQCLCICCGQDVTLSHLVARRDLAQAKINEAEAVLDAVKARNVLEQKVAAMAAQVDNLDDAYRLMRAADTIDLDRLRELRERKVSLTAYLEASAAYASAVQREAVLKAAADSVQQLVVAVIDQKAQDLQRAVSVALPKYQAVQLQLRDGSRQVCRLTMTPGKGQMARDFRALSGAERVMLVSAFASAAVAQADSGMIPVVLIDEVWLDGDSLRSLMKAMARNVERADGGPAQVIVAVVSFKGAPPEGWTVIDLDNGGQ